MQQKTYISFAAQDNLAQFVLQYQLGLMKNVRDAERASPRRKRVRVKTGLDSEIIGEVHVSPETDRSNVGLAEVRIENRPTCTHRNRTNPPRSRRRSLGMRPGRHTKDASETANKSMPHQQVPP